MVGLKLDEFKQAFLEVPIMQAVLNAEKEEGKLEVKKEIATNMLKKGIDVSYISRVTGLSEEEVTALQKQTQS